MHAPKKTVPKARRIAREIHGKGCPKAAALKHRLECVRGESDNAILINSGTWLSEKKVPLRNVMGNTTKLMNTLIS